MIAANLPAGARLREGLQPVWHMLSLLWGGQAQQSNRQVWALQVWMLHAFVGSPQLLLNVPFSPRDASPAS